MQSFLDIMFWQFLYQRSELIKILLPFLNGLSYNISVIFVLIYFLVFSFSFPVIF